MGKQKSAALSDLVRMLNLLPYFQAHPGRSAMEAATDLGRSPHEILDDLNRLWMCGLPGYMPGDLVDLDHSFKSVQVVNSQGMDQPLRLTRTEAGALLLALENLEAAPGLINREAVENAAAKIRDIMGAETRAVYDAIAEDTDPKVLPQAEALGQAVAEMRQLSFDYYSLSRDVTAPRTVSPARVFTSDGSAYFTAWDHELNEHRTFKLDRMSNAKVLDEKATPHSEKHPADNAEKSNPFEFSHTGMTADLLIDASVTWLADYLPIEIGAYVEYEDTGESWYEATMPIGSVEWFERFIIGQGGLVRVVAPEEVVQSVSHRAKAALQAYDRISVN